MYLLGKVHLSKRFLNTYEMIFSNTIKDQCYRNFSVKKINSIKIFFVQIVNKHLLSRIPLLKCIRRSFLTYLKDAHNTYYQIIAASNISIATIKTDSSVELHWWQSKRIPGYNERLLTQFSDWLKPEARLNIFSYVHDTIHELKYIQTENDDENV